MKIDLDIADKRMNDERDLYVYLKFKYETIDKLEEELQKHDKNCMIKDFNLFFEKGRLYININEGQLIYYLEDYMNSVLTAIKENDNSSINYSCKLVLRNIIDFLRKIYRELNNICLMNKICYEKYNKYYF